MNKKEGSTTVLKKSKQYLTFYLGNEVYGFPVESVKEVNELSKTYQIPKTPDYIKGVINLRGEVLPVIDLSVLFYGRMSEVLVSTSIVFIDLRLKNESYLIGAMIDAVEAVVDVPDDDVSAAPDYSTKIRSEYISGIGKVHDAFIILLNISTVFNLEILSKFSR